MAQEKSMSAADAPAAPLSRSGRRGGAVVVLAGALTTALALLGVWWLDGNTDDFHVMGWYADYVIPAGALLVGMAAGSGYGIASYLGGFRIRRGLLLSVVAFQLAGYGVAQYLEFRSLTREAPLVDASGETLTFARFYHLQAMSFAWEDQGRPGQPLGAWGYLFVGLGVVGFALGGVVAPALLMKAPYCERCELYMKSRVLALVPASSRPRRVGKKDAAGRAALQEEHELAAKSANATLERVTELAGRGDALAIETALSAHPARGSEARRAGRLAARLRFALVRCRHCSNGFLRPDLITGQGHGIRVQNLAHVPLPPDAVRLLARG
jgi:hypothetical protein